MEYVQAAIKIRVTRAFGDDTVDAALARDGAASVVRRITGSVAIGGGGQRVAGMTKIVEISIFHF